MNNTPECENLLFNCTVLNTSRLVNLNHEEEEFDNTSVRRTVSLLFLCVLGFVIAMMNVAFLVVVGKSRQLRGNGIIFVCFLTSADAFLGLSFISYSVAAALQVSAIQLQCHCTCWYILLLLFLLLLLNLFL
jgi:hypothetical protein